MSFTCTSSIAMWPIRPLSPTLRNKTLPKTVARRPFRAQNWPKRRLRYPSNATYSYFKTEPTQGLPMVKQSDHTSAFRKCTYCLGSIWSYEFILVRWSKKPHCYSPLHAVCSMKVTIQISSLPSPSLWSLGLAIGIPNSPQGCPLRGLG